MANPTCRNCNRSADAGAYCSPCDSASFVKKTAILRTQEHFLAHSARRRTHLFGEPVPRNKRQ